MNYDEQEKQIAQQRARYLQQQDQQAPQGRMVGGRFVGANPLEYLAAGLRGYGGIKGEQLASQELKDLGTQKQKAIADALRTFGEKANPSQAGTGATNLVDDALPPEMRIGAQPQMAPRKPDLQGAYGALISSGVPQLQQMGTQGMVQMPQLQATQQEREDNRAFRQQEAQLAREARAQELQMRMQDQRISQQEKLAAQRELQQMQIDARKDMQRMIASTRQAPQAQIIQTDSGPMQLVGGKAMPITGPDGKPVSAPKKGAAGLSATAQKELFEADDAVQNGMGAISSLNKAMELNNKAYSGVGASARATLRSNLPGGSEAADATIAMENIIKDQALTSMKSIFGGNPTEGERAILLDLQASASKTPKQREEILTRATQAAQRRLDFNKQKADALRGGSYMSEGGAPQVQAAPAGAPKRLKFDAQGNIIP
jgi:hypothetical protein